MNWLRHDFSSAFRLLHELNCNEYHARKGNSCSLLQFMIRSVNSCNTVAIHCVFSVKDNTYSFSVFSLTYSYILKSHRYAHPVTVEGRGIGNVYTE